MSKAAKAAEGLIGGTSMKQSLLYAEQLKQQEDHNVACTTKSSRFGMCISVVLAQGNRQVL